MYFIFITCDYTTTVLYRQGDATKKQATKTRCDKNTGDKKQATKTQKPEKTKKEPPQKTTPPLFYYTPTAPSPPLPLYITSIEYSAMNSHIILVDNSCSLPRPLKILSSFSSTSAFKSQADLRIAIQNIKIVSHLLSTT